MVKIFIIAGEPSGDVLGGKLMKAIKNESRDQKIEFVGIGGKKMGEQGLKSIFPISELSIMGFAEIIPHLPKLLKRIKQTAQDIIDSGAQIVITIDSPDFCFRVIKKLNKNPNSRNIKKIHMIAPSVWAYRPKRAEKISKLYDLLLAILPFEPPYFEKHGLETAFIGHPIVEDFYTPPLLCAAQELALSKGDYSPPSCATDFSTKNQLGNLPLNRGNNPSKSNYEENDFRRKNQIKEDDLVICAMAGSRAGEVKRMLPEIIGALNILAEKYPNLVVVMPTIERTRPIIEESLDQFKTRIILIDESEKYQAFKTSNLAIAKSGTNNLEIAMAGLPMITIYKINPITHFIVKRLIKIKYANLINLILNQELIPELLQDNCVAGKIANTAINLLDNPDLAQLQISEGRKVLNLLGLNSKQTPSQKAAKKILSNND